MTANNYRIGNYIIDFEAEPETTIYWQIEEIQRLSNDKALNQTVGVTYRNGSCWTCDIEPIPINEETLIKLGFKKVEDLGDMIYFEKERYGVCLDHEDITFYKKLFKDEIITLIYGEAHFLYVHQLQNLYFALTGSELVFSEA